LVLEAITCSRFNGPRTTHQLARREIECVT
jgi:hypothetical protein